MKNANVTLLGSNPWTYNDSKVMLSVNKLGEKKDNSTNNDWFIKKFWISEMIFNQTVLDE